MIRYIGFFHDRDHCSFGDVAAEGEVLLSLEDAKSKMRERLRSNLPCDVDCPLVDDEGRVSRQQWEPITQVFPAVTGDAYMDLYMVSRWESHSEWGRVAAEPSVRIGVGPRGGVRTENV